MRMGRYSRVFIAMAVILVVAGALVRGCKRPELNWRALTGNDVVREYLNETYEAQGVGVSMMSETGLLITLINPAANELENSAAQEAVAREIARYVLNNQEGLPEIEDMRVRFDTRQVAGSPPADQLIFDFSVGDLR